MHKAAVTFDAKVREIAKKIITDQVDILAVPFKGAENSVFVSRDVNLIVAIGMVQVDGQNFFFGHKR